MSGGYIPHRDEITYVTKQDDERRRKAESDRAAKLIADRKAREAEQEKARETAAREQGRQELERYETEARASLLASGGSAADFARIWPDLKASYLKEKALERMSSKERRAAAMYERLKAGWTPRL
jgi:hypothetical protein